MAVVNAVAAKDRSQPPNPNPSRVPTKPPTPAATMVAGTMVAGTMVALRDAACLGMQVCVIRFYQRAFVVADSTVNRAVCYLIGHQLVSKGI